MRQIVTDFYAFLPTKCVAKMDSWKYAATRNVPKSASMKINFSILSNQATSYIHSKFYIKLDMVVSDSRPLIIVSPDLTMYLANCEISRRRNPLPSHIVGNLFATRTHMYIKLLYFKYWYYLLCIWSLGRDSVPPSQIRWGNLPTKLVYLSRTRLD